MVTHYRAYFSAEYATLKREIGEALHRYEALFSGDALAAFQQTAQTLQALQVFWGKLCLVPAIPLNVDIAAAWKGVREALLQALSAKQAAPLDAVDVAAAAREAFTRYTRICQEVTALSRRCSRRTRKSRG